MSDSKDPLKFSEFAALAIAENEEPRPSMAAGIRDKGAEYSMTDDDALDSLDMVEAMQGIEEMLENEGYPEVQLDDGAMEEANNFGDVYRHVCELLGTEPIMDELAAAA